MSRHARACRRRAGAGDRAACSWTTTATAVGSVRRQLPCLRSRGRRRARRRRQLPVEGHRGELRAQGSAHRHEPAVSQRGQRTLHRRVGASGIARVTGRYPMTAAATDLDATAGPTSTSHRTPRRRSSTATTRTARSPTWPRERRGLQRAGRRAGRHGTRRGRRRPDGQLDLLKTHFADDIPALYRALGRAGSKTSRLPPARRAEPVRSMGSGMPDLDNDGLADLFIVTGNVYPESRSTCRSTRTAAASRVPEHGRGAVCGRDDVQRTRRRRGALESRRGLRRHRQRRRRGRARDEHERAPVAAAQRPAQRERLGRRPADRHDVEPLGHRRHPPRDGRRADASRAVLSQASYYSHDDVRQHFGLGAATRVERLEVQWPNGAVETLRDLPVRQILTVTEGKGLTPGAR